MYLAATILLCATSIAAIGVRPFDIGLREFDLFLRMFGTVIEGRTLHTVLFLVLAGCYTKLLADPEPWPRWLVPAVVTIWFLSVPWISPDVFFYLAKGWMEARYGLDPYVVRITDIPAFEQDAIFSTVVPSIRSVLGNYGPRFQDLSRLIARASNGSPIIGLFLFKAVGLVALWGIDRVICHLASAQGGASRDIRRWIWLNPLLLANFVGAAHNDVYLTLLMLLGVLCVGRQRLVAGCALVGFAVSIKLAALFIVPVVGLGGLVGAVTARDFARRIICSVAGAVLGLLVGFVFRFEAIPYFASWANNDSQYFRSSIHMVLQPLASAYVPGLNTLAMGKLAFVVIGGLRLLHLWKRAGASSHDFIVQGSFEMLVLGQLLAMQMMNEWYLLWPMAFALVRLGEPERQWIRQVTFVYMPVVIWAIVGWFVVVVLAQWIITFGFTASVVRYFRASRAKALMTVVESGST